jgi:ATP adenylyltransferase
VGILVERLWSPWRLAYVTANREDEGCVFCAALGDRDDSRSLVVHRGVTAFVLLNLYPYNNGHLMVVPNRHIANLASATVEELNEMMQLTRLAELALTETYEPHGLNMGINLGRPAGAGILDHLHLHVVPRWNGDTNFMTAVGETRVLPEDLQQAASRLRPAFARLAGEGEGPRKGARKGARKVVRDGSRAER